MNLVIDIGNSLLKIAVFDNNSVILNNEFNNDFISKVEDLLDEYPITHSIISNVSSINEELNNLLLQPITDYSTSLALRILSASTNIAYVSSSSPGNLFLYHSSS